MEKHKQRVISLHHKIIKKIRGFTIIELIIVIVIIGILFSIGLVSYGEITKKVFVTQIKNDLINAAEAMEIDKAYNRLYPSSLPSSFRQSGDINFTGPGGSATISLSGGTEYCIEATSNISPGIGTFSISSYGPSNVIYDGGCWQNLASNNVTFWKNIFPGYTLTCGINSDDKTYCWGLNDYGQLGNGNTGTNQSAPVAVSAGAMPAGAVKSVTGGRFHTCAIASDSKAYCWGRNYSGELGNGNTGTDRNVPVAVSAGAMPAGAVKSISAGGIHNCAIASDDKVYCWGGNTSGQLGNGNSGTAQNAPVAVLAGAMPAGAVRSISAGSEHTCAIASDYKVYCWGRNDYGQLGNGTTGAGQSSPVAVSAGAMPAGAVTAITVGTNYTCAIASDSKVYCWGRNLSGQLGNGDAGTNQSSPVAVSAGAMPAGAVTSIFAGQDHTCAIASDSKAYCWGRNNYGQLGNGDTSGDNQSVPVAVSAGTMPAGAVKSIIAGQYLTCALASNTNAYCWGYNSYGQLGNGNDATNQKLPVAISAGAMPAGVIKLIGAGYGYNCTIASDNKAYCWGDNYYGQLGNGNTSTDQYAPVAVSAGAMPAGAVKSISAAKNSATTCAIASDDNLYCWGYNAQGQQGSGNYTTTNVPVAVSAGAMPAGAVKSISSGGVHTCAIASDSNVYCWGKNDYGQLGNGNTGTNQNVPVAVSAGAMPVGAIKSISVGTSFTCAIASDDKVYCWGYNFYGQLGNGNTGTNQNVPVAVSAGAMPAGAVKSVASGQNHACAIASDNNVYCWGYNLSGQLGSGNNTTVNVPVAVSAGAMPAGAVKSIAAGQNHTCAIASDDKAYCWGHNYYGQLGNGNSGINQNVPVAVLAGNMPAGAVKSISAGYGHTCSIASNDKVYCWGNNSDGQLGSYVNSNYSHSLPGLVTPIF